MKKREKKLKYLILGGGPAGLTFANMLLESGEDSFLVLEKETEAGGLCKTKIVDEFPLDIGGGHFLDTKRKAVNEFLFRFLPEREWNIFERDSRIKLAGKEINHPLESNIWQMELEEQIRYLKAIAMAGCNKQEKMPKHFCDWIIWKLGECIAEDYMIPYNQKMFGKELEDIGTYWLDKLPNVSFEETLRGCLTHKAYGTEPGHSRFYYPRNYGYGELWRRMSEEIGDHILYKMEVKEIDFIKSSILTTNNKQYSAEHIITTIPWISFHQLIGMPDYLTKKIPLLKHNSIVVQYLKEELETDAQWIYYPDENLSYHRILVRKNFCVGSQGHWTETNEVRFNKEDKENIFFNEFAYPINTIEKPQIIQEILSWCREKKVYGLGRWGEHQHYNSDVTVELAMNLYRNIREKE